MKKNIPQLVATALFAVLATTTAQANSRLVTQGRAGYAVMAVTKTSDIAKNTAPATTVALVMQKPQQPISKMQAVGRAGYIVMPNPSR